MSTHPTRSEQVVADFIQRKLAQNAMQRVRDLLGQFEEERALDRRAARFGVIAVTLLVGVSLLLLFSASSLIIN